MTKYKMFIQDMLSSHKELFDAFKAVHQKYEADPQKWQTEFNEKGEEVLSVIRRYENMLCGHSENSGFGKYSSKLSEKFWTEIKSIFSKIDYIGTTFS